jgi:ribosomal protein S12 methylthiotransferase
MLGYLRRAGYDISPRPDGADTIILNTCGFIRPARNEAGEGIAGALALKKERPGRKVAVVGCFVEKHRADLERRYPGVDVWLGVKDFDHIVEALEGKPYAPGKRAYLLDRETPRLLSTPSTWAYLKISEGCSHECSFCAIPSIKGPYNSRSIPSIAAEAEGLAGRGVKEINLVSQDTTYFGREKGSREGLTRLLRRLVEVRGIRWIRLLYGYPEEITAGLLEVLKENKICPYLDLPFQHADRSILRRMKRSMDGKRALRLIERVRREIPNAALRTSLIVGFPGEGPDEFLALKEFVREAQFDHLGVFPYSREEGTSAFTLGDPVPEEEKVRRRDEIMALQAGIAAAALRKTLGRRLDVLIDPSISVAGGLLAGRTRFQAPEVDGVVEVEPRARPAGKIRPLERVEIISTGVYDLRGILI